MYAINENTKEIFNLSNFKLDHGNQECELLHDCNLKEVGSKLLFSGYDNKGNKYTASQSLERHKEGCSMYGYKTPAKAMQLKDNDVVNFYDYKRAKEEREATRKEIISESFNNFKIAANKKIAEWFY